jgi:hypothetical protein
MMSVNEQDDYVSSKLELQIQLHSSRRLSRDRAAKKG